MAFANKAPPPRNFRASLIISPSLLNPLFSEQVKKELILDRKLWPARYKDPAGRSNQKCPRAPTPGGRDGKTLGNKEERGREEVGCTEKAVVQWTCVSPCC